MRLTRRRSVVTQAVLIDTLLVCASVVCISLVFLLTLRTAFHRQLLLRAETLADFLARESVYGLSVGDRAGLERTAGTALAGEDVLYVAVSNAGGEVLVDLKRRGFSSAGARHSSFLDLSRQVVNPGTRGVVDWEETRPERLVLGAVRLGFSTQKQDALFNRILLFGLGVAAVALVSALGLQYFHLRRMFRPLRGLIEFTRSVAKGDLTRKACVYRLDEFGDLSLAFNQMVDELNLSRQEMSVLLQEAQEASRLKSQFLANMSHEIRTPMNGIVGMTTLALGTQLTVEQRDYISMAQSSAESLLALLNDILDFSKIEAGKMDLLPEEFSVARHVEGVVKELSISASQKGLRLGLRIAPEVPDRLVGDPVRLRQVLFNLIGNAVKFTERGSVMVSVEPESRSGESMHLHFSVADTGIGIPPDKQQLVFEAFRQGDGSAARRYGGTGLGLAISSRLVTLMGGRIWLDSQSASGSTFHFTARLGYPGLDAPPKAPEAPAPLREIVRRLRILLAEDNLINQKIAVRLLEKRGHEVVVAANGLEALAALEGQTFDVVLMDVQMPEMDGLEASGRIREREKGTGTHIPIVAMTAHAMKGDREKCLAAGMDGYVAKPVRAEELFAAVESAAVHENLGPRMNADTKALRG